MSFKGYLYGNYSVNLQVNLRWNWSILHIYKKYLNVCLFLLYKSQFDSRESVTDDPPYYRCCTHILVVLRKNKQAALGYSFECSCRNPRKSKTVKNWSFFEIMKINIRDALVYIRTYLLQEKNKTAAKEAGISQQAGTFFFQS